MSVKGIVADMNIHVVCYSNLFYTIVSFPGAQTYVSWKRDYVYKYLSS